MTQRRKKQRKILEKLFDKLVDDVCKNEMNFPENWDEVELSQLLADKAAGNVLPMEEERRKNYALIARML